MKLFCPECRQSYDDSVSVCPDDGTRLYRLDPADDPLVGAVLDERFRVDWLIGQGGMGAVYRGMQLSINRQVAIKVLRTEFVDREVALERFFREAKVISGMTHPNIVRLIEFGQDKERDLLYLVMELVDGTSLSELLGKGRLKASFALEVAYQICGALTEPHANEIIHRDLKPDNLLLGARSDGTLETKVLDFGIARAVQRNTRLTQTGMICGTPAYMAPEQSRDRKVDARTDLYALGVLLYEMLAGRPPFMAQSSLQIMLKHIQEEPPSLREVLPSGALPEGIETLVYDLIAKDPAERPASARVVRTRIEKIRAEFDLESVRLDAERSPNAVFADWVLPAMPTSDELERGNTLGLVKETDLFAQTNDNEHSTADTIAENAPTEAMSSDSDELIGEVGTDTEIDKVVAQTPAKHVPDEQVKVASGPASGRDGVNPAAIQTADDSGAIAQRTRAPSPQKRTGEAGAVPAGPAADESAANPTRPGGDGGLSTRALGFVAVGVAVLVLGLGATVSYMLADKPTADASSRAASSETAPEASTTDEVSEPSTHEAALAGRAEALAADTAKVGRHVAARAVAPDQPEEPAARESDAHNAAAHNAETQKNAPPANERSPRAATDGERADTAPPTRPDRQRRGHKSGDDTGQERAESKSINSPQEKSGSSEPEAKPPAAQSDSKQSSSSGTDLEAELEALVNDDE